MKVYIEPRFDMTTDSGEGGIKQVIRHVTPHLEALGMEFVTTSAAADVVWYHASPYTETRTYLNAHPEKPVVCSTHGLYWAGYDWDQASLAANADVIEGLRLADVVTAPSAWVKNAIDRGILADVRVVYHGVDMDEWEPVSAQPDVPYALWDKTRIDPICDPTDVIRLASRMPEQRFVLCAGPDGVTLPNVAILGRLPYDKARALTLNASVYLCITRETFGLATLQAMAAGVPVVGYRFGGQSEIIRDESDGGILVEPGDVDALGQALADALANRETLGLAARERAASYTWQEAARLYRQAFDDAVTAHESPVRVTVVTTAYNAEKTIARTLASFSAAAGEHDEIVIVDDASTDTTGALIDGYAAREPRAAVIHRSENGYLAQARNDALAIARGRYVMCLDADDELTPDALNVLAGELDRDRATQIAYGKLYFMGDYPSPDGQGIETKPEEYGYGPGRSPWPFAFDWAVQAEAQNVTCIPYCAMMRTDWLRRAGGWRTRCRTGEDLDLWMRLVSFGARPRMVTDADILTYHTSTTSMSVTNRLPEWGKWYPWTGAAGILSMPPWGLPSAPPRGERAWPIGHNAEPLVSVIIPVGPEHDRYVLDAVDSVMAQTFRRWECIVVNDTGHTLGCRLPGWVKLVEEGPDTSGVAAARNAGLRAASAPYVVFLDADDWLDRTALDYLTAALEPHPELTVAYPDYWERTAAGTVAPVQWHYKPHMLHDWDCDAAQTAPGSLYGVTAIYRTDALRAVGGFDVDCPGHEDADLQMALTYAGYCAARIPRRLYVYNLETGQRRNESKRDEESVVDWIRNKYTGRDRVACGTCGGRASVVEPIAAAVTQEVVLTGAMTEVQYNGAKAAPFTIRGGQTGMTYMFAKGDIRPVMNEDLGFFEAQPEYVVLRGAQRQPDDAQPELTVDGPPSGRRANVA